LLRAAVPGGFTLDDFTIDTASATAVCPAGHTVARSDPRGCHQQRKASFKDLCTGCPLRQWCTKAKAGRVLTIRPHHDFQAAARRQGHRPRLASRLPPLATTGRTRRRLVHHGNRRLRYRSTITNDTWLHTRAAAHNLRRLINLGLTCTNGTWHLTPTSA
jgi:hypothetical protein